MVVVVLVMVVILVLLLVLLLAVFRFLKLIHWFILRMGKCLERIIEK